MNSPPTPMGLDAPATTGSRKRGASAFSPPLIPPGSDDTTPRILNRYHHRRDNVASSVWGPDIPVTSKPDTSSTPQKPSSNVPPAPFNIYKSLLRHPNLFFQFTLRLPLTTAISLYAIDKEFHYLFNKYSVSILHDYARYWAPVSSHVFTWVLFPQLCISDPMLRPMNERVWLARDVPGWRWVGMVMYRQSVVRGILESLTLEGCGRLPARLESVVYKFWLLIEFQHSHLRQSFLQDTSIWADADILLFHLFMVKLEMRITHPVLSNSPCCLAHLMLNQKSLTPLFELLTGKGETFLYEDLVPFLVRTYPVDSFDLFTFPFLDDEEITEVDEEEWNILGKEGWDENGAPMEFAVDCVVSEGIRRELQVQKYLLDFVVVGYEEETGLVREWRKGKRTYEGWLMGREREKVIKGLDERFGLRGKREKEVSKDKDEDGMDLSL